MIGFRGGGVTLADYAECEEKQQRDDSRYDQRPNAAKLVEVKQEH
jgi:hypothetical protein